MYFFPWNFIFYVIKNPELKNLELCMDHPTHMQLGPQSAKYLNWPCSNPWTSLLWLITDRRAFPAKP